MRVLLRCNYKQTWIWSSEVLSFQMLDTNYSIFKLLLFVIEKLYSIPVVSSHICKGLSRFKKKTHLTFIIFHLWGSVIHLTSPKMCSFWSWFKEYPSLGQQRDPKVTLASAALYAWNGAHLLNGCLWFFTTHKCHVTRYVMECGPNIENRVGNQ